MVAILDFYFLPVDFGGCAAQTMATLGEMDV